MRLKRLGVEAPSLRLRTPWRLENHAIYSAPLCSSAPPSPAPSSAYLLPYLLLLCDDEDVDDDVVGTDGPQSQPDGGEDNEVGGDNYLEYNEDDV